MLVAKNTTVAVSSNYRVRLLVITSIGDSDKTAGPVVYLAGFIESWRRGVEKGVDALKADHLPMPEYTVHPDDIMIKFTEAKDRP